MEESSSRKRPVSFIRSRMARSGHSLPGGSRLPFASNRGRKTSGETDKGRPLSCRRPSAFTRLVSEGSTTCRLRWLNISLVMGTPTAGIGNHRGPSPIEQRESDPGVQLGSLADRKILKGSQPKTRYGTAAESGLKPGREVIGEKSTASKSAEVSACTCENVASAQAALGSPWKYRSEPPSAR